MASLLVEQAAHEAGDRGYRKLLVANTYVCSLDSAMTRPHIALDYLGELADGGHVSLDVALAALDRGEVAYA